MSKITKPLDPETRAKLDKEMARRQLELEKAIQSCKETEEHNRIPRGILTWIGFQTRVPGYD